MMRGSFAPRIFPKLELVNVLHIVASRIAERSSGAIRSHSTQGIVQARAGVEPEARALSGDGGKLPISQDPARPGAGEMGHQADYRSIENLPHVHHAITSIGAAIVRILVHAPPRSRTTHLPR